MIIFSTLLIVHRWPHGCMPYMGVWLVWFVPARVGNAAALNIVVRNPLLIVFVGGGLMMNVLIFCQ